MSPLKRKILFYLFILAFLIISPIVILYAAGYKIDWQKSFTPFMIQKTGMIIIESEPPSANIFLNNKELANVSFNPWQKNLEIKTPTRIKNILPGDYDLKVGLPQYWPWARRIKVNPGQITHVLDIMLFKNNPPILLTSTNAKNFFLAPNNKKIFLPEDNNLFDIKSEQIEKVASGTEEISPAYWSSDSTKILSNGVIINIKSEKNLDLVKTLGKEASLITWDKNNSNKIYYVFKDAIYSYDLNSQLNEKITSEEKIFNYLVKNNQLLLLAKNGQVVQLKSFSLSNNSLEQKIDLPASDNYEFINTDSNIINVLDTKYKILYLIDLNSANPLAEIFNNVKQATWFDDKNLFVSNDFEISQINLDQKNQQILTRISEPIKGIIKTKANNYLLYYTDNALYAMTWDQGDYSLQITELLETTSFSSPTMSLDEKTIYFLGDIEGKKGLFKLEIQ